MRARLFLLAAGLAAFGGSLFAGFHVDDYAIFQGAGLLRWRPAGPLAELLWEWNGRLAGQEPAAYHAVNLLLHLGAVLLAYECLRRLTGEWAAALGAAIFAVHPLQAEAVNYAAERSAILAAVFCLAALWAWTDGWHWLAVAAFAAALAADARCAAFPLVLSIVRREERSRQRWAALGASALLAIAVTMRSEPGQYAMALPTLRFLRLLAVPWGFTIAPAATEARWVSAAAMVAVAAVAAWKWRSLDVRSAWTWLLAGLVLLIPGVGANPAADPRMYLPMFAFAAAAGLLLGRVPQRAVAVGVVAALAAISVSRTYVWMSDERLWREAVRRAPSNAEAKIQLAKSSKAADALELLARARELEPHNAEIPAEIGKVLLDEGQYDAAVDELSRAVALNPNNALAFNNRGVSLAALGQIPAATADLEHALALDPQLNEARENLKRLTVR